METDRVREGYPPTKGAEEEGLTLYVAKSKRWQGRKVPNTKRRFQCRQFSFSSEHRLGLSEVKGAWSRDLCQAERQHQARFRAAHTPFTPVLHRMHCMHTIVHRVSPQNTRKWLDPSPRNNHHPPPFFLADVFASVCAAFLYSPSTVECHPFHGR